MRSDGGRAVRPQERGELRVGGAIMGVAVASMRRVSKAQARKLFNAGDKPVILCPCRMHPGRAFSMGCTVFGREWLERAERYRYHPALWEGTVEATAWGLMYREWAYYNATSETGRYAHYYVEE